jgi:glycoside hydrolase-like protein
MNLRISVKQLCGLIFVFAFTLVSSGFNSSPAHQAEAENQVHVDQFDMMTESFGWVLLDRHLFQTSDAGQTWNEISPSISSDASIQDVEFIDTHTGWMLWTATDSDGGALFQLSQTNDGGITWATRALSLFESGEIGSNAEKAEMGWFDARTGWISVKQISGSNFSMGVLFTTSDGGSSWSRFILPIADKIYFSDPQMGWAIGGPTGDEVFNTQDAGASWRNVRPADIPHGIQATTYPPIVSGGQGLLVMTTLGVENNLMLYSLANSVKWLALGQVKLDVQPGIIGISILDPQNFVTTIPGTKSIVRMTNGELDVLNNEDGLSASIVELDMVSMDVGWAKSVEARCVTDSLSNGQTASVSCSSTTRLLQTTSGGATWQNVDLPIVPTNRASLDASNLTDKIISSAVSSGENTLAVVGQGFDRCEIPTLSQMQTWSDNSPYQSVNLYIGGSSRACDNTALISSYLFQLYQQGWKFFPTWVGPQAPCSGYFSRMSSDVTTAYQQGVDQANLAVERLAGLGLTGPAKTGSVVYYDIEHYGTNAACRSAVNSFMDGWVSQIRASGNLAGVYGSTLCNTGLSDFLNITNVPDVIWPARWYHNLGSGYYDPDATVWDLGSCIPNTAWSNHQRIRQYEGDHDETWGSLTLDIDSNVLDGVVAIPYDYPFASSIIATDSNPTNASSVHFTVNFSKPVTGVNRADFALNTTGGISGMSVASVAGSGNTYTVTVNTGTGTGTIRLDVVDDDSITDAAGNKLGGTSPGNGNFTTGEVYTVNKPPEAATLISPSGNMGTDFMPTYTWNEISNATWYYLWVSKVNDNGSLTTVHTKWYDASLVCSRTTCTITPIGVTLSSGNYRWWIQTWNEGGYGPWSSLMDFSLPAIPPPGEATLVSPNGSIADTTPTYTWNKVNNATWYYLWVSRVNGDGSLTTVHTKWYDSPVVCGPSSCSIAPAGVTLSSGNYRWWIQTWNDGGYGPWTSAMNFSLEAPGAATLVSPNGSIAATTPDYTWNKVNDSTWYYLWVSRVNGDGSLTTVYAKWYTSAEACSAGICSITPDVALSAGDYRWWIQTWNEAGYGPWSSFKNFTLSP